MCVEKPSKRGPRQTRTNARARKIRFDQRGLTQNCSAGVGLADGPTSPASKQQTTRQRPGEKARARETEKSLPPERISAGRLS